ncbi:alternate-type signal peptide domain-containing protein [Cellulomonas xiejunii]|uniref:alternate-type signal peptide domain-containing protein n=1 Tax=Cellulomonas xiejunii TaxID=2968083 RepID=UPI001D0E1B2B|nr:alternate-type signal peptide domain-containing protein [Cellulomonas xiejunii]MCC2313716.1 alternate-type signal peptide domain-containing protein [Cellulomonas xiejunii]
MNKRTKALVAGGAGAVILLGTAGTFAVWSDEATVGGAVVTGGKLQLTDNPTITWKAYDISDPDEGRVPLSADPDADGSSKFELAAGVELEGTTTITPELKGEYLKAELVTKSGEKAPAWLDVEWKVGGDVFTNGTDSSSVQLTPADVDNAETLTVSIRLAANLQDASGGIDVTAAEDYKEWTSGKFTVTLTQLPPSQS